MTGQATTTNQQDAKRTEAMAKAILRRADDGKGTTVQDLVSAGFSQVEIHRLGTAAVELANRMLARKGRSESTLTLDTAA